MSETATKTRAWGLLVPPLHEDEYPIRFSEKAWVDAVDPRIPRSDREIGSMDVYQYAKHMIPVGPAIGLLQDAYYVHVGHYSKDPKKHEQVRKVFLEGVIALHEDKPAAVVRKGLVWVHEDHRGKNLCAEMAILWLLYFGFDYWLSRPEAPIIDPIFGQSISPAIEAYRRKQYRMMFERGIMAP